MGALPRRDLAAVFGLISPARFMSRSMSLLTVGRPITSRQLTPGQVITCGGIAYTVHQVRDDHGAFVFTVTPKLPKSGTCST